MDRNSIIGIVLIGGIFLIWMTISNKNRKEIEEERRKLDSNTRTEKQIPSMDSAIIEKTADFKEVKINEISETKKDQDLGEFKNAAEGEDKLYTLENEFIKIDISAKGGRPYTVELKEYKTFEQKPLILFTGDSTIFGIDFSMGDKLIYTNTLYFEALPGNNKKSLTMRLKANDNKYIDYIYSLDNESYMVDFSIKLVGLKDIYNNNDPRVLDFQWEIYSPKQEKGWKNESYYTTLYYKLFQAEVKSYNARTNKDIIDEEINAQLDWIAYKDQFFSSVMISDEGFNSAVFNISKQEEDSEYIKKFGSVIGLNFKRIENEKMSFKFYFGPNSYKYLKKNYADLELYDMVTVGKGIIRWINQILIINIFNFLERFIGNYGIIILLLTIVIKILLLPLTYRSYISQAKMKVLKPQIDEINKKIPKEKAMERQQATMALYKKVGVSPLGGCLPMVLQMPILFAMFRFFPASIELRQESFLWAHDLSTYDAIFEWNQYIPIISKFYGNHISLFTLLMTVSTILSMKFNSQTTTSSQQMPGMKGMMYFMPVMFMFVLNGFSAALTYYYFLANMITFGQNWLFKQFIDEEEVLRKLHAKKEKNSQKTKKSGGKSKKSWMERMADARGVKLPKR